jgi:hypothetical protein
MDFGGGSRPSPCFLGRIDGGQLIPVNLGTRARAEYFVNNLERRFKGWRDDVSLIQSAAFLSLPASYFSVRFGLFNAEFPSPFFHVGSGERWEFRQS